MEGNQGRKIDEKIDGKMRTRLMGRLRVIWTRR
jgi:hypothetical protein